MAETNNEGKMVNISQGELNEILATNRRLISILEAQQPGGKKVSAIQERSLRLTLIGGRPIVAFKNRGIGTRKEYVYSEPHPTKPNEEILFVDVQLMGKEEWLKINYLELMQEASELAVVVVKRIEHPWTINQGEVEAADIDWDKYQRNLTGDMVPVDVNGIAYSFLVRMPDTGEEIEVTEDVVNIK